MVNWIKSVETKTFFLLLAQYGKVNQSVKWVKIQVPKVILLSEFHCIWSYFWIWFLWASRATGRNFASIHHINSSSLSQRIYRAGTDCDWTFWYHDQLFKVCPLLLYNIWVSCNDTYEKIQTITEMFIQLNTSASAGHKMLLAEMKLLAELAFIPHICHLYSTWLCP